MAIANSTLDKFRKDYASLRPGEVLTVSSELFNYLKIHTLVDLSQVRERLNIASTNFTPSTNSGVFDKFVAGLNEPSPETRAPGDSTNPKDSIGSSKVPLSLVPTVWLAEQSLAYLEGKLKYGEVNWRATPIRASVYIDAAMRHLFKFAEGEDCDPVTQVHHLSNAAACFGIIIDAFHYGTLIDDRKMSNGPGIVWMDSLVKNVQHLQTLHKDKNPKHFKKGDEPHETMRPD